MSYVNWGPFPESLLSLDANVHWYRRLTSVSDNMDRFGFTMCDATSDEIITEQKGVFRTNCLDWYEILHSILS